MRLPVALASLLIMSGAAQAETASFTSAQAHLLPVADDAHTVFQPNIGGEASGRIVQLPQGGLGVTTGGTPYYQTYGSPGGGGVAVPNGNFSTVIGSGGRTGIAPN